MKRKYLRNILEDILEFLGSRFWFLLAITLGVIILGVIILQYYDVSKDFPVTPLDPHMRP